MLVLAYETGYKVSKTNSWWVFFNQNGLIEDFDANP